MFQFTGSPSVYLWIQYTVHEVLSCGLPHSDIFGSLCICHSPKLFAAYHVFHRLLVPRHSPYALFSLSFLLCLAINISCSKKFALHAISVSLAFDVLSFQIFLILSIRFSRCNPDSYPSRRKFSLFEEGPAATYSPVSSPIQYLRPIWSSPSCSGWERVLPHTASPPEIFFCCVVHSFLQVTLPSPQVTRFATCFARRLVPGCVPYTNLLPSQSLHASMHACSFKRLLQEL